MLKKLLVLSICISLINSLILGYILKQQHLLFRQSRASQPTQKNEIAAVGLSPANTDAQNQMLRELIREEFAKAKQYFGSPQHIAIKSPQINEINSHPLAASSTRGSSAKNGLEDQAVAIKDKIDRFALTGSISQAELTSTLQQIESVSATERHQLLKSLARQINRQNIQINNSQFK